MSLNLTATPRGFLRGEFLDRYGASCSIQDSSLATEFCIWLGKDEERMHLTQAMVQDLLPHLEKFVRDGHLGSWDKGGNA